VTGRVITGPVQIGDNWPGMYIAGQDALIHYHGDMRLALRFLESKNVDDWTYPLREVAIRQLREFLNLLDSCEVSLMRREGRVPVKLEQRGPKLDAPTHPGWWWAHYSSFDCPAGPWIVVEVYAIGEGFRVYNGAADIDEFDEWIAIPEPEETNQ
jgi:hypothetical protein